MTHWPPRLPGRGSTQSRRAGPAGLDCAGLLRRATQRHAAWLYEQALQHCRQIDVELLVRVGSLDDDFVVRLDPLPTRRATNAIAELCEHLTATRTCYPGTNLILSYEIKTQP